MKNKIIQIMKDEAFGESRRGDLILFESNFDKAADEIIKLVEEEVLINFCKSIIDFEISSDTAICDFGTSAEYFVNDFIAAGREGR